MGLLQRRFPAEIDAISSPQVSPRWFEALGKQDRVLRLLEFGNAGLLLSGFGQEDLSFSSCFGFAQNETGHWTHWSFVAGCTTGSVCPIGAHVFKGRSS